MDKITLITAIVGCVTGVCGLLLSVYKAFADRPRLQIDLPKPYLDGFTDNRNVQFVSKKILIVNVRLMNVGLAPISIKNAYIREHGIYCKAGFDYPLSSFGFELDGGRRVEYTLSPPMSLPYFLDAGTIKEVTLIFPFSEDLYNRWSLHPLKKLRVYFCTPRSTLCLPIKTIELTKENVEQSKKDNATQAYKL